MTKIEALELELAARKMVEGTGLGWWEAIKIKHGTALADSKLSPCGTVKQYELALGIIEGKPVWEGDKYYDTNGRECTAGDKRWPKNKDYWAQCYWNPPKPKTGLIELSVEDIKYWSHYSTFSCSHEQPSRLYRACRKALENLK